jgi:hypothetical protein
MTERRPHWDTELEQSVSAILFDCYNNGVSEEQVYQAIAAVEDWVLSAPIFDLYLSRKHAPDKAAIARVRELHGRHDPNCPYGEDCAGAGLCLACREEYPCATIRALDGLEGRIDD